MIDPDAPYDWTAGLAPDSDDLRFRRKAWVVIACALAAFWIVLAGIVALVLR